MRDFIAWLRYVLDIEKPYSDYESDSYLDRQARRQPTIYQKVIVTGVLILGALGTVLVLAE